MVRGDDRRRASAVLDERDIGRPNEEVIERVRSALVERTPPRSELVRRFPKERTLSIRPNHPGGVVKCSYQRGLTLPNTLPPRVVIFELCGGRVASCVVFRVPVVGTDRVSCVSVDMLVAVLVVMPVVCQLPCQLRC